MEWWYRFGRDKGLMWRDLNKESGEAVMSGGVPVVLSYIILFTLLSLSHEPLPLLVTLSVLLSMAVIGVVDDFSGWLKGLPQYVKPLLSAVASLPVLVITWEKGTLYAVLSLLGVVGASNAFNMVAGFNGLEAGMALLILYFLSLYLYLSGLPGYEVVALSTLPILVFFVYNRYPSRVFPGDVFTYSVGSLIAMLSIVYNVELLAALLFLPYFVELVLKTRGRIERGEWPQSIGIPSPTGLKPPYERIYSLSHVFLRIKGDERFVVYAHWFIEMVLGIILLVILLSVPSLSPSLLSLLQKLQALL